MHACMHAWVGACVRACVGMWVDRWIDGWVGRWIGECTCMHGWVGECVGGWMDGWICESTLTPECFCGMPNCTTNCQISIMIIQSIVEFVIIGIVFPALNGLDVLVLKSSCALFNPSIQPVYGLCIHPCMHMCMRAFVRACDHVHAISRLSTIIQRPLCHVWCHGLAFVPCMVPWPGR